MFKQNSEYAIILSLAAIISLSLAAISYVLSYNTMMVHQKNKILCRYCNKQFSTRGTLAKHSRTVHEGVKFPCTKCDKQFTQKGYVVEH